jgi:hypothetical protein
MLMGAEEDDVIVTVAHPWGDIEAPLQTWIEIGPGPRPYAASCSLVVLILTISMRARTNPRQLEMPAPAVGPAPLSHLTARGRQ